ncbi:V-set and immunoglobulin domain-containing protein 1-like isoform X1 [Sebastes umbrosus]|uniref:V-set and immunoglobulin domain-containing protein 1-like isoform X1 n=1 Tax=Sebastes umbrosus TaxID=72105 RepID=UPI00189E016D|nr:V-set and immunoglobulin domain-containing protein 1-like isoform X1 [Sebastes umbrosus]
MTPPMFALYLSCLLLRTMADTTAPKLSSPLRFVSVSIGENVTLECFYEDSVAVMFYWYKQAFGQKPQLVSKFYKHDKNATLNGEFKNDPRFKVEASTGKNHLKILYVQLSDSATYFCISGYSYQYEFAEGAIVHVKGSGLNVPALVQQSASETVQPGGSVTLSCTVHTGTCDGEHSVYWFRNSEESHPGLIYTHGGRNDQCEKKSNTQTHTCVYNLPIKSLNRSHVGTYYCAVASCGHILFGNGTKLDFKDEEDSLVLVYFLSGALAFTTILVVFLACKIYKMYKTNSCQCTDSQARSPAASAPNAEGCQDADSLHYAAIRVNRATRSTRQRDDNGSECVYSGIKQ